MSTLEGKKIVIVGGSSGLGFGVAKASLLNQASEIIIASHSKERVANAVSRLETATAEKNVSGKITGLTVDARDLQAVKAFILELGEIDHLVWTSGDSLRLGFMDRDIQNEKDALDIRYWSALQAAQVAKIKTGGSITLTIGSVVLKPGKGWTLAAGMMGAVESATRGLAVDLAPTRVNSICPGFVDTELWDVMPKEDKKSLLDSVAARLPVKHVADADEISEAYLFVMKCNYITGQRICVEGGNVLA